MRRPPTACARSSRPPMRYGSRAAVGVLMLLLFGCGSPPRADELPRADGGDFASAVPPDQLPRFAADLAAAGQIAYYLGPAAAGHDFVGLAKDDQGPMLIIEANYGPCDPGAEGYCGDPISVSTQEWERLPAGFPCSRLEPRLSVPTAVIGGQLELFTGRLQIKIIDDADLNSPSPSVDQALVLVTQLRTLDGTGPLNQLPPPAPEVVTWLDKTCPVGQ